MKKVTMLVVLSALIFPVLVLAGCASVPGTPYGEPCTTADGAPGTQNILGACYRNTH